MSHVAVVLAAGHGTRMKSDLPKVLHRVAGRPMLSWVLDAVEATKPDATIVVVGHGAEAVVESIGDGVEYCIQHERRGTGHATQVALEHLGDVTGKGVLVVPGDTPLITGDALQQLVDRHAHWESGVVMLSAELADPSGYGRVVRSGGTVLGIVEDRDANIDQRSIREINAGMYLFCGDELAGDLASLEPDNAQGELYVTDVVGLVAGRGERVDAIVVDESVVAGINTLAQLADANRAARERMVGALMAEGVTIVDPARTYIDATVTVERGATLYPGCHLEGSTIVSEGAVVGPDVFAVDSVIGPGARVWYSVLRGAQVGGGCDVGPYTTLRPGTILESGSKAGSFVELKNTVVEENAKVPHLSYLGDARVGRGANVGAGTITCNYDGFEKNRTDIGEGAFIGSDTMLVAPVSIGDGAVTGAGSVITEDVPAGALAIERSDQTIIAGYASRKAERYRSQRDEDADKER